MSLPCDSRGGLGRGWWQRWKPAWQIKWRGSAFRINFDLHRAGGLWLALFVFAWSSVGFNLDEVYRPVMGLFFDMPAEETPTAAPPTGTRQPSGRLVQVSLPTGQHSGTTVTSWLDALHMAHVFGMRYRVFVCLAITYALGHRCHYLAEEAQGAGGAGRRTPQRV